MIMNSVKRMTMGQLERTKAEIEQEVKRRKNLAVGQKVWYDGELKCEVVEKSDNDRVSVRFTGYNAKNGFYRGAVFTTTTEYLEPR